MDPAVLPSEEAEPVWDQTGMCGGGLRGLHRHGLQVQQEGEQHCVSFPKYRTSTKLNTSCKF